MKKVLLSLTLVGILAGTQGVLASVNESSEENTVVNKVSTVTPEFTEDEDVALNGDTLISNGNCTKRDNGECDGTGKGNGECDGTGKGNGECDGTGNGKKLRKGNCDGNGAGGRQGKGNCDGTGKGQGKN